MGSRACTATRRPESMVKFGARAAAASDTLTRALVHPVVQCFFLGQSFASATTMQRKKSRHTSKSDRRWQILPITRNPSKFMVLTHHAKVTSEVRGGETDSLCLAGLAGVGGQNAIVATLARTAESEEKKATVSMQTQVPKTMFRDVLLGHRKSAYRIAYSHSSLWLAR